MTPEGQLEDHVKALFASCSAELLERAVATACSIRPDLALTVISESASSAGRWIRYRAAQTFTSNLRYCRGSLKGKQIEVAIVMLQPHTPYRRLQVIAFLVHSRCLLAMNENLDYFEVRFSAAGTVLRHLRWRAREWFQRFGSGPRLRVNVPSVGIVRAQAAGFMIGLSKLRNRASSRPLPVPLLQRAPGISVVIPSRNGKEMLARMLPAVLDQMESGEIIVVNNGSDDGSAELLRQQFPRVAVLEHAAPLPFAAAVNIGVQAARFSHVCLLNNDMAIAPNFLRHLRQAFDRVPDLFCAAAQVFLPAGLPRQETGKTFIRGSPAVSDFPVRCEVPIEGEDLSYVLYGSSGCSMYDARRLASLQGFDEIYKPAYVEDLDAGVRAWQQGWPSVFVANAHVIHEHRATMSRLYSKERLEYMVLHHWLLFLARTVRERAIFARYWHHAVTRLSCASGTSEAKHVIREIGVSEQWRPHRHGVMLSDAEILALCDGSVAVFPGARDTSDGPVILMVRLRLPHPHLAVARTKRVMVAFVDRLGPVPAELREQYSEIVTVQRPGSSQDFDSASFHAALRQTVRKWRPEKIRLEDALAKFYAPDCEDSEITIEP